MAVSVERLKEAFDYHEDGYFIRKVATGHNTYIGQIVRGSNLNGYRRFCLDYIEMYMHRAIFAWHTGYWPTEIDHKDRNKANNRIGNLRETTRHDNLINRGATKHNKTGRKFISKKNIRGYIYFYVKRMGVYYGLRKTLKDAVVLRDQLFGPQE